MALGSRTLLNLGLALSVTVLLLLAIYEPGKELPKVPPRLVELNSDGISKIRIERVNGPTVELARQEGTWRMGEPLQLRVSDYRINSLLRITETRSLGSFIASADTLAQYGLASPNASLILNDTTRIDFGSSTPIDQRRYVRVGETVHLISDNLYYHLIGTPTSFASNTLLDGKEAFSRIELPGLNLAQHEGKWQASPSPANFSADQVTQLIDHWRHAQALEVAPYDGRKGDAARLFITGSDQPIEFVITQRRPELVLARPDLKVQYHLPQASVDELLALKAIAKNESAATDASQPSSPH